MPPVRAAEVNQFPHISVNLFNYSFYDLPANLQAPVAAWQTQRFDTIVEGSKGLQPYWRGNRLAGYIDFAYVYANAADDVRATASKYGFNFEDMLLHANADYSVSPSLAWKDLEQFDAFEQLPMEGPGMPSLARNGAFLVNGSSYTDVTVAAYDANPGDVAIVDRLLLGYAEPFAEINFELAAAPGGYTVAWQYWNGSSYAPLALLGDGTFGLTRNGRIQFLPPPDWARHVENGSRSKYWVQAVVARTTGNPVASRIYGASWLAASSTANAMGWAANDPNIVNKGKGALEYNPAPPPGSSARFRYQARATGIWNYNAVFGNPANVQLGQRTWPVFLADTFIARSAADLSNAVMFDDTGAAPPTPQPNLDVPQTVSYQQIVMDALAAARDRVGQLRAGSTVGVNTTYAPFALAASFSATETVFFPWIGPPYYGGRPADQIQFDTFLDGTNPTQTRGYLQCVDSMWTLSGAPFFGKWHYWDRGNRSPLACLAAYYIGTNGHTGLNYTTIAWRYPETDEFYAFSASPTKLTAPVPANTASGVKKIVNVAGTAGMTSIPPVSWAIVIRLGNPGLSSGDIVQAYIENGYLYTFDPIYNSYAAGTAVYPVNKGHQAVDSIPPVSRIWKWSPWFPAMAANIGTPDPGGLNGGARVMDWLSGVAISGQPNAAVVCAGTAGTTCPGVMRRDFTNAIVLFRPYHPDMGVESEYDTPSKPISLGGNYYPLLADGSVGSPARSVTLRGAEGAILFKKKPR